MSLYEYKPPSQESILAHNSMLMYETVEKNIIVLEYMLTFRLRGWCQPFHIKAERSMSRPAHLLLLHLFGSTKDKYPLLKTQTLTFNWIFSTVTFVAVACKGLWCLLMRPSGINQETNQVVAQSEGAPTAPGSDLTPPSTGWRKASALETNDKAAEKPKCNI